MTDTYELPELPEPDMSHQKAVDDYDEETSYSAEALQEYARLAVKAEREHAAKVADSLNRPDELRLRMGEMKAQEMRSVQAVLRLVAAAIRKG